MTNEVLASGLDAAAEPIVELFIEFDGRQVSVRTDVSEMSDYLTRTFRAMLVPYVSDGAGSLHLYRSEGGFTLHCPDPLEFSGDAKSVFDYVRHEVLIQFIRTRQDLFWLHAGAAERDGGAVLVSGPSGEGKSTLVTMLCERGWHFMSDDVAPLRMDTDVVLPYPQTPLRRIKSSEQASSIEIWDLERELVLIPAKSIQREPVLVKAIVFPVFQKRAGADLTRISEGAAALELLRNCTSLADQRELAVDRASRIARTVPVYRISYGAASGAADVVSSLP